MGISIRQMLCYGMMFERSGGRYSDPLLTPEGLSLLNDYRFSWTPEALKGAMIMLAGSLTEAQQNRIVRLVQKSPLDPFKCIHWDDEYGIEGFVGFIPPSEHSAWYRYDDLLDYYSFLTEPELKELDGIYPYIGSLIQMTAEEFQQYCRPEVPMSFNSTVRP